MEISDYTPPDELTAQDLRFIEIYALGVSPYKAATGAGFSTTVARNAWLWVTYRDFNPTLYDACRKRATEKAAELIVTRQQVLTRYWMIATADPNELIELRQLCCRYCHGNAHAYQWTPAEFMSQCDAIEAENRKGYQDKPLPDPAGGLDFDGSLEPHPQCPECHGRGQTVVLPKNTEDLSPGARALYAGVEMTKQGLKIKMHDQLAALGKVADELGVGIKRLKVDGPGDLRLPTSAEIAQVGPQDAAALYQAMMASQSG